MSRKSEFLAALMRVIARSGGSSSTREAREQTARMFAEVMFSLGFTALKAVGDIRGRHMRDYVVRRQEDGIAVRTLHKEMSHLRKLLRESGCNAVANAPELSNQALGLTGASRKGTNRALPDEELGALITRAVKMGRPGFAAAALLERVIGLRRNEAIHARSDTLARWERELVGGLPLFVFAGAKGGRSRAVAVIDVPGCLVVLRYAQYVAALQDGFLIQRGDGEPFAGLKSAVEIYKSWMKRAGVKPHGLRYAFAQEQKRLREASGFSRREALIATSLDLGHGDGRGKYIESVYCQEDKAVATS